MKIRGSSLFFLMTCAAYCIHAQSNLLLIRPNDLVYKNDSEKMAFLKYERTKDTTDVFDLLFNSYDKSVVGNKALAIQKVNNCVEFLKESTADKSEVKKVKHIYDYVHKQFLKVYKLKNSFIDVFETGEYNCVSATALYALIFSKLSIPYQIRETPEHVYLIAYPNSGKILIETTAPVKGYYQFSDKLITSFVRNLYESKMISKEEYEETSSATLFNKYYFTSESVSLFQLTGLQYSNFAIYFYEENDLKNANEEIKKAYYLFPGAKHKYILKSTLGGLVDKDSYSDSVNVNHLVLLCRFNNLKEKEVSDEAISNEFIKIINTQLISNSDYKTFDRSYEKIYGELNDTILKNDIAFDYHYELARLGYLNSKNLEYETMHLSAAYKLHPLNANLRTLILAVFDKFLEKYNDSKSIMELSDDFSKKFNFLNENDSFLSINANCILDLAYQNYYLGSLAKGDGYLREFEDLAKQNSNVSAKAVFVEKAYSQAAGEYYRKGNISKAKQILKSGLIYAPNSFGLQQRLNQLK